MYEVNFNQLYISISNAAAGNKQSEQAIHLVEFIYRIVSDSLDSNLRNKTDNFQAAYITQTLNEIILFLNNSLESEKLPPFLDFCKDYVNANEILNTDKISNSTKMLALLGNKKCKKLNSDNQAYHENLKNLMDNHLINKILKGLRIKIYNAPASKDALTPAEISEIKNNVHTAFQAYDGKSIMILDIISINTKEY